MKKNTLGLFAIVFAMAANAFAAEPTISVAIQPRYPWNGNVDVKFTITGDSGTKYDTSFTAKDVAGGTNLTMKTLYKSNGAAANPAKEQLLPGNYNWAWDAQADLGANTVLERVAVTAETVASTFTYSVKFDANGGTGTMANESFTSGTAKTLTANAFTRTGYTFQGWATSATGAVKYTDKQSVNNLATTAGATVNLYAVWKETNPYYMVIDLSMGASVDSYPVTYLDAEPVGGFNVEEYKTTKLVLKLLPEGSFIMGDNQTDQSHKVTLTKQFFMGLFEVTQKQWLLVMGGSNPSTTYGTYGIGDAYPVHHVSYNMIRGSYKGAKWPASSAVDATSFLGKLQSRTKVNFDLPTEAQWEYACRAGTTTAYYWGSSMNGDYAWYYSNSGSVSHPVGGKRPNAWGLYDMSGNVLEWNVDWSGRLVYGTDPKGSSSGTFRSLRGGDCCHNESGCTSSDEYISTPDNPGYDYLLGFRLSLTLP